MPYLTTRLALSDLTHQKLLEYLIYYPLLGLWEWRNPSIMNKRGRTTVGTISVHGYRIITINGTKYRSGRLAWFYMTGEWPQKEIDHEDRDKTNDKWYNLRDLSRSENALNRDLQSNNTSGVRGVRWDTERQKWNVQVKKDGISYFGGRYDSLDEAVAVRDSVALELHGDFAELNTMELSI